jgi:hypothetical protein
MFPVEPVSLTAPRNATRKSISYGIVICDGNDFRAAFIEARSRAYDSGIILNFRIKTLKCLGIGTLIVDSRIKAEHVSGLSLPNHYIEPHE